MKDQTNLLLLECTERDVGVHEMSGGARNWLQEAIEEAVSDRACMQFVCATCGGTTMRGILLGEAIPEGRWPAHDPKLSLERARFLISALRACSPNTDPPSYEFVLGVRSVLYGVWLRFGAMAHADIFPDLDGSWAGTVLEDMKQH